MFSYGQVCIISPAYRTEESKPWVLPVVRKVEASMASDMSLNKEYLPVAGLPSYTEGSLRLLLGDDSSAIQEQRVCSSTLPVEQYLMLHEQTTLTNVIWDPLYKV